MSGQFTRSSFISAFKQNLPFAPTTDQQTAIEAIAQFIEEYFGRDVFVLKGYAGTGKTNLVSVLAKILPTFKWKTVLLAPTGRAAKVLSSYAKLPAQTIHKKIFKKELGADGSMQFSVGENLHKNTIFIVDEASMIGLDSSSQSKLFDSLLENLFEYVFSGENCKLLFVGDTAQLPPVGSEESPALNVQFLKKTYSLDINSIELRQVARQSLESGILQNATYLRELLNGELMTLPKLQTYPDVVRLNGEETQDILNEMYSRYGFDDVLVLTRSNKRANLFNQAVRARVRYMEDDMCSGDLLMVVKNNYFWLDEKSEAGFIANGDALEIKKIIRREELYGFNFLECVVHFIDYPQLPEMQVKLILESIYSDTSSLTPAQQQQLFENVMADMGDEPGKFKRLNYLKKSPYFNALQIKFLYAVTCHKAQGGQWPVVFIDQGYINKEQIDRNYLRWLYTAFTRAQEKVYLINFSEDFF
jgi:ATP-dependent exoDNAse (exonuclease V) alpha subunit